MSSSPRRSRYRPARSLRSRLLIGQLLLLTAVCLGIGAATELALHRYLVTQLDTQLDNAAQRAARIHGAPTRPHGWYRHRPRPGPGPDFLDAPGQPVGMVAAVVADRTLADAGRLGVDGARKSLTDTAAHDLLTLRAGEPATTRNLDGVGRYRLVAVEARHRDRVATADDVIVVGLPLSGVYATLLRVLVIFGAVTAVALIAAAAVGSGLIGRALAPLRRVAQTASEVANLPLDRGEAALPVRVPSADADPHTEVGRLGLAVNRMLDHIATALATRQASETRVRKFVADASHELRTPLAAIRGYTELAQRIPFDEHPEVAHAMSRVRSESDRMTRLVEDLLLLARLDSGRSLERERVDLSQLAVDAVSDAHAAGPGHRWRLDLPDEPVTVIGDAARLHQVLANLLANARVHTEAGTEVEIRLRSDTAGAELSVTDNGPGIDPALQAEIFQRFARGDTSRSRKGGSTGLGLAITSAVVRAHGGTVTVDSRPGRTEFTVRLPERPPPPRQTSVG